MGTRQFGKTVARHPKTPQDTPRYTPQRQRDSVFKTEPRQPRHAQDTETVSYKTDFAHACPTKTDKTGVLAPLKVDRTVRWSRTGRNDEGADVIGI